MEPTLKNLLLTREILISAIKDQLDLADQFPRDLERRRSYVLEATRLSVRFHEVQKRLEEDWKN